MGELARRLRGLPRALLPLYAGTIVTRLGTFVVPYLTVYLAQERGLSLAATGRVVAAGGAGLLLGNLLGGWSCDRVGRKPVLLIGLALNVAGLAWLAAGTDGEGWAFACASLGAGAVPPATTAWIADLTRGEQRQLAYTVQYVCINVGMGLGPLLGGLLARSSFGTLFLADIATTVLCAGFILAVPGGRPHEAHRTASPRIAWTPANRRIFAFACGSLLLITPLMGLEYAVPLLVDLELGAPLLLVGVVYSINASIILSLSFGLERRLSGRDPRAMMVLAGLLWTAGLGILAWELSVITLLCSTVVWTVGEMIASVVVPTTITARVAPALRGRFLAIPDAMRSLASIAAPLSLGLIWDRAGVDVVLRALVTVPLLGALGYGVALQRRRRA